MVTNTLMGHYMPLTWLSFAVSHAIGGMDPWFYHVVSLLLHALNAALLTLLAWRLIAAALGRPVPTAASAGPEPATLAVGAAVAGLAFGIHPLRAETVAWATDRGDVLCGTFFLASLLAYCRAVDESGRLRWRPWGLLALLAMVAALLSKEAAVMLPIAMLVLDAYPLRRLGPWPRLVTEKLPFFALSLAGGAVAIAARAAGARFSTLEEYSAGARVAMAAYSLWYYAAAFVLPWGLAPYHEPPVHVALLAPRFLGAALGGLLVTAAVVALRRRWPAGLAAWVGYALVLAPVSGVVHSGSHLVADRYSYLPTAAFAILLGGAATVTLRAGHATPSRRRAGAILLCGIIVLLMAWGAVAWRHSASWRDPLVVWQVSVAADPQCRLCALNLAAEHFNVGQLVDAEVWARRAIERWPGRGTPHHRLGAVLLAQGRDADAETELREAIRLAPGLAEAYRELGRLHARQGRFSEATGELGKALALGAPATEVEGLLRSFPPPATKR